MVEVGRGVNGRLLVSVRETGSGDTLPLEAEAREAGIQMRNTGDVREVSSLEYFSITKQLKLLV